MDAPAKFSKLHLPQMKKAVDPVEPPKLQASKPQTAKPDIKSDTPKPVELSKPKPPPTLDGDEIWLRKHIADDVSLVFEFTDGTTAVGVPADLARYTIRVRTAEGVSLLFRHGLRRITKTTNG